MPFKMLEGFKPKPLGQSMAELDKLWAFVGQDGGPMIPLKEKDALDIAKKAAEQRKVGKCKNPMVKLGTENGNLVFRIEADDKYVKDAIVVKGYDALKAERAKTTVVNAQAGDGVIDKAAAAMGRVKGTAPANASDADLNAKGDTAPIVILAHGTNEGTSPGKVFAKEFADKKPAEIIKYIVDKKLDKNYAGIIYLDGCYTAAGPKKGADAGELTNFCKTVYEGLVREGYKHLQVKGNLGRAATLSDGKENVLDAQEEARLEKRKKELSDAFDKLAEKAEAIEDKVAKLEKVSAALTAKHHGNAETLTADPGIKLVADEVARLETQRAAADKALDAMRDEYHDIIADMKPRGKYRINDLVGVFGPEKLVSKPWYKTLFS